MFVDVKDIKIKFISEDYETMNIIISCEKKFKYDPNIIEEIEEFEGGDIKEGDMRINIQFKLRDFKLDFEKKPIFREPFPGLKLIYFKISDKNDNMGNYIIKNVNKKTKK